jgi:hypothetical protein
MAIEVVKHARSLGLSVPHDLSIVGSDNIPLASLLDPPLTSEIKSVSHTACVQDGTPSHKANRPAAAGRFRPTSDS